MLLEYLVENGLTFIFQTAGLSSFSEMKHQKFSLQEVKLEEFDFNFSGLYHLIIQQLENYPCQGAFLPNPFLAVAIATNLISRLRHAAVPHDDLRENHRLKNAKR